MDKISLKRLNQLHPAIKQLAIEAYTDAVMSTPTGCHPFITQTLRTFAESNDLYAQGRTKPGPIVTKAKGGQSLHNYGLAIDFVIMYGDKASWEVDENWMTVVKCFKKRGFDWGGDWKFKDYPHFEMSFGKGWRQCLALFEAKDFIPGNTYVNI